MSGPYFQGGPKRDGLRMIEATSAFHDVGGLPREASLVFSQLLLNLAGHCGKHVANILIDEFLSAADAPMAKPR